MDYRRIQVPDYLKPFVQYYWVLENSDATSQQILGPLVDGCPGLMFHYSASGKLFDKDNMMLPKLFLYGQTIRRAELYLTGTFITLGVCFHPHALNLIFGIKASELTDQYLDPILIKKAGDTSLIEQLLNATSISQQFNFISSFLWAHIERQRPAADAYTQHALQQIILSNGAVSLRELQRITKLSERSFERRFDQRVGISPKLFAGVCRFQASLHQLQKHDYKKLSDIAFDNGYADQSHFIRVFKSFTGYTPLQFLQRSAPVITSPVKELSYAI